MFDSIGSKIDASGNVTILVLKHGKPKKIIELKPEISSVFIASLLVECAKLGTVGNPTEKTEHNIPVVVPTGFGLYDSTQTTPVSLMLHFGKLTVGIAIPDARSLGEALIASGAKKTLAN